MFFGNKIDQPYGFTGRPVDKVTGLYNYRFRDYNPKVGRFIQPDPLGQTPGPNIYAYCNNNPINWVDPWGMCREDDEEVSWWDVYFSEYYEENDEFLMAVATAPDFFREWWRAMVQDFNTPSAPGNLDPYGPSMEDFYTQGAEVWSRTHGNQPITSEELKAMGEDLKNCYEVYQQVRDSIPPGTPITGNPAVDRVIDGVNAATSATESLIDYVFD